MKKYSSVNRSDPSFPRLEVGEYFKFPDPESAEGSIVAVGGNLSPGMLISAYMQGIFPWFNEDEPLFWQSPDPRFVILPEWLHIPSRLEREIKNSRFRITADTSFEAVISFCSKIERRDQEDTWITDDLIDACIELHDEGFMHSIEAWDNDELAGGFYGMHLDNAFFGESMFFRAPGASKIAFSVFAKRFFGEMQGAFIDCQVYTDHMARFGAKNISRQAYLRLLSKTFLPDGNAGFSLSTLRGSWARHFA